MNNDLISRSALIKWIDDSVSQYYGTYSTDMLNMWGLFKDYLINNAPTVEERPQSEWISGFKYALDKAFSEFDSNCTYSGDRVLQKLEKLKEGGIQ